MISRDDFTKLYYQIYYHHGTDDFTEYSLDLNEYTSLKTSLVGENQDGSLTGPWLITCHAPEPRWQISLTSVRDYENCEIVFGDEAEIFRDMLHAKMKS